MTAAASSLVVPAVTALTARLYGVQPALWAGALAALLPLHVELGAELLADGPHLAALAGLLLCLTRLQQGVHEPAWALGAALCGGVGYLIRPESLAVLGAGALALAVLPRPAGRARVGARLRALGWLALPGLLGLLPYLLLIRDEPVLGGESGAGLLKLTKKQNLPQLLAALAPGLLLERALELCRRTLQAALPLLPGLTALALRRRPGPPRCPWHLLWLGAWLAAAFLVVRADRRFAAQLVLFALPSAGLGCVALCRALPWPQTPARRGLAVVLALACAPYALLDRRVAKRSFVAAGDALAALGAERVLGHDSRPAYYAGATPVTPLAWFDPSRPPPDAAELLAWAREHRADALVVEVKDPADVAVSRALAQTLGRAPRQVRLPGAVPLDVYALP